MRTKSLRRLPGAAPVGRSSGSTPGQIIAPVCAWLIVENGLTCVTESCVFRPSSQLCVSRPGGSLRAFLCPAQSVAASARRCAKDDKPCDSWTTHPHPKLLHLDEGFRTRSAERARMAAAASAEASLLFIVISRRRVAKSRTEWASPPEAHCFSLLLTMEDVGNAEESTCPSERCRPAAWRARATPPRSAAGPAAAASGRPTAA